MGVSYAKLRELLIKRGIQRKELKAATGIGVESLAKINKDEYISLANLEKIAKYLDVDIGDIASFK